MTIDQVRFLVAAALLGVAVAIALRWRRLVLVRRALTAQLREDWQRRAPTLRPPRPEPGEPGQRPADPFEAAWAARARELRDEAALSAARGVVCEESPKGRPTMTRTEAVKANCKTSAQARGAKAAQLEREIQESSASPAQKSDMLHTLSKLGIFSQEERDWLTRLATNGEFASYRAFIEAP